MPPTLPPLPTDNTICQSASGLTDVSYEIERAIVERLAPLKQLGFRVLAVPDSPADLSKPMPQGCCMVHYDRSVVAPPQGLGLVSQEEIQVFVVTIAANSLRSSNGAQLLMRFVQMLLVGFKAPHSRSSAYVLNKKFAGIDPKARLWEYVLELAVPTAIVEALPADTAVLLERLTLLTRNGSLFLEVEDE